MEPFASLLTWVIGWLSSLILGGVKKGMDSADKKIPEFIKPIQPVIVGALAVILPMLAKLLGIIDIPSADIFAAAPVATLIAVVSREVLAKIKKK